MEDTSNILGFSMFNTSHPFYPEFVRSLNMSWRENCEASTYPGPAVSTRHPLQAHKHLCGSLQTSSRWCSEPSGTPTRFLSTCYETSNAISHAPQLHWPLPGPCVAPAYTHPRAFALGPPATLYFPRELVTLPHCQVSTPTFPQL